MHILTPYTPAYTHILSRQPTYYHPPPKNKHTHLSASAKNATSTQHILGGGEDTETHMEEEGGEEEEEQFPSTAAFWDADVTEREGREGRGRGVC